MCIVNEDNPYISDLRTIWVWYKCEEVTKSEAVVVLSISKQIGHMGGGAIVRNICHQFIERRRFPESEYAMALGPYFCS